jgi:hypothetical protein
MGYHAQAPRVAWYLLRGHIPEDLHVLHKCPGIVNPRCVNPDHLYIGTILDNNLDTRNQGRAPWQTDPTWASWAAGQNHWSTKYPDRVQKGSQTGRAKLVEAQVSEIRARFATGESKASLGRVFGVSESMIRGIVLRRAWRHI